MKAERGAPSDLASSSRRDDGDAEERDKGPELHAMRSVWLAMRDEDPPERGLAELLAAARTKAGTMQVRPTSWQRLIAGWRRPPAFALATVMVLVSGAVILGRRGMDVPAPARAPGMSGTVATELAARERATPGSSPEPDERTAPVRASARPGSPAGSAEAVQPMAKAGPGERAMPAEASTKVELTGRRTRPAEASASTDPAAVAPTGNHRSADPAPVVTAWKDTDSIGDGNAEPEAPRVHRTSKSEPIPEPASRGAQRSEPPRGQAGASDDLAGAASSAPNEPPPPADTGEAANKLEREDTSRHDGPKAPASVTLEQLYQQCETAARRGDCATVRRLVVRITTRDRGYRARIAKDSAVGKCLADTAE